MHAEVYFRPPIHWSWCSRAQVNRDRERDRSGAGRPALCRAGQRGTPERWRLTRPIPRRHRARDHKRLVMASRQRHLFQVHPGRRGAVRMMPPRGTPRRGGRAAPCGSPDRRPPKWSVFWRAVPCYKSSRSNSAEAHQTRWQSRGWSFQYARVSLNRAGQSAGFYLVVDDLGRLGTVWREADTEATDYETVFRDLLSGQYNNPVRVVSFQHHWRLVARCLCRDRRGVAAAVWNGAAGTSPEHSAFHRAFGQNHWPLTAAAS